MQEESLAHSSLFFLGMGSNKGAKEAMPYLDVSLKTKGYFLSDQFLRRGCATEPAQWAVELRVQSAGGVKHLPWTFKMQIKMEIQNSLRSTLMADEEMWTPEKVVVTWKNTSVFQIRKQMHLFGFCTVHPVQRPEYWNLFLVLMWGWEYAETHWDPDPVLW